MVSVILSLLLLLLLISLILFYSHFFKETLYHLQFLIEGPQ